MRKIVFTFIILLALTTILSAKSNNFVTVKDGQLMRNGKPYRFIGMNYWYGSLLGAKPGDRARLKRELDFLQTHNISNLRVMVGAEGISRNDSHLKFSLQPKQGEYDDNLLDGLDYFMAEAGKRGLTVVLYLSNNWEWSGGFAQYLEWNGKGDYPYPTVAGWSNFISFVGKFYSCQECLDAFNRHCKFIIGRTNRYTKKAYTADPAIMAWEIANEPRPDGEKNKEIYKKWIGDEAKYLKSLDNNHLLAAGTEGSRGTEDDIELWKAIHTYPDIDYTTIHIWAKNWSWIDFDNFDKTFAETKEKMQQYVHNHAQIAAQLHKPMVIEEIGFPRDKHLFNPESKTLSRDQYFKLLFSLMDGTLKSFQGVNIWAFGGEGRVSDTQYKWKAGDQFVGDPPQEEQGLNTIFDTDNSTWKLINQFNPVSKK